MMPFRVRDKNTEELVTVLFKDGGVFLVALKNKELKWVRDYELTQNYEFWALESVPVTGDLG